VIEFHRVVLADLPAAEAQGWTPAVTHDGAVGADLWCAGTLAVVPVVRELAPLAPEEIRQGASEILARLEGQG
jgi:hypothetical protein